MGAFKEIDERIAAWPASFEELSRTRPAPSEVAAMEEWLGRALSSKADGVRALSDALADGVNPDGACRHPHPSGSMMSLPALSFAARQGDMAALGALLGAGARPDGPEGAKFRPLGLACVNGQAEAVGALLAAGADPDGEPRGDASALEWAIRMGHGEVAKMVARAGARAGAGACSGGSMSAAEYARDRGSAELAEWLDAFEGAREERKRIEAQTAPAPSLGKSRPRAL